MSLLQLISPLIITRLVSGLCDMMSNKLVVKCGNFAVLVDLLVLPRGTSKDTSWFSDHEKKEVCMLLKDTIESRVRRHIESRRQQPQGKQKEEEYTQASPLFVKGSNFRLAAYFIKRWVKLRCIVKHQHRELYVFPDRFVVCASHLEPISDVRVAQTLQPSSAKESSSGTSEYFAERGENEINSLLSSALKKQAVLKNIIKKTKAMTIASSESSGVNSNQPEDADKGNQSNAQSEPESRSVEHAEDCRNTTRNSLELPDAEVENNLHHRQPTKTSSRHQVQCGERFQAQDSSKPPSWSCESASPEQKQTLRTSIMQQKRRRHSSEGKAAFICKKANLRDDTFLSHNDKGAAENEPLALRVLNAQTLPAVADYAVGGEVKTELVNTAETDKMGALSNCNPEERCSDGGRRPTDRQPKKSKLQRLKKVH